MKPLIIALLFLPLAVACSIQSKRKQGNETIAKIEQFQAREKRLPRSLNEVGVRESEDGPVYYRQLSESRYELSYGTSLGDSVTYDSDRKSWK